MARKSKFTEQEIVYALKQVEAGVPLRELCRKYGVSEQTFYRWRSKYGGLTTSELQRLKQLEQENKQLKKLVADLSLDKHVLQEVIAKKL
jgi:putative transposase